MNNELWIMVETLHPQRLYCFKIKNRPILVRIGLGCFQLLEQQNDR